MKKLFPTKVDLIEYMRWRLGDDPTCASRYMVTVWRHHTNLRDGFGFRRVDDILIKFARQYAESQSLSPGQTKIVVKRMPRYARQIVERYEKPERVLQAMIEDGWWGSDQHDKLPAETTGGNCHG